MNGINPLSIALKKLNSSAVQPQTKTSLQLSLSSMSFIQSSTKVTPILSGYSHYQDILPRIKSNVLTVLIEITPKA